MHQYTIDNGKLIGNFEGLYKDFKIRFYKQKKKNLKHQKSHHQLLPVITT